MPSFTAIAFLSVLSLSTTLSSLVNGSVLPRDNDGKGRYSDPAFTISTIQLDSVVSCVGGIQNAKKPFLLVPGTAANATLVYDSGWRNFLGKGDGGLGYDVCYVSPPPYMEGDIQNTLEYIVNAVHKIYDASGTKMPVMGHSQGGLAIASALTYYPSIRKEVSQYISLAGDVHGTTGIQPVPQNSLYNTTRAPAIWQQGYTSDWVKTLRKKGGWYNWIPTTTLFTLYDRSVRPQSNNSIEGSATYIAGKFTGNILVQESCPELELGHNDFLTAEFGYQVVKLALESKDNRATTAAVKQAVKDGRIDCSIFNSSFVDNEKYNSDFAIVLDILANPSQVIDLVHAEPLVRDAYKRAPDNEVHDA